MIASTCTSTRCSRPHATQLWHAPHACTQADLDGYAVLVQGQDLANGEGGEIGQQDGEGGPVAGEGLVGDEVVGHLLRAQLDGRLASRQRIGLRKEVAHQLVVVAHHLSLRSRLPVGNASDMARVERGMQGQAAGEAHAEAVF